MERSTKQIVKESWSVYCRHWGPLTGASLVVLLIANTGIALPFMGPFYMGMCGMALAAVRGKKVSFDSLFDVFSDWQPSLWAGMVFTAGLIIPATMIFLVGFLTGMIMYYAGNLEFIWLWGLFTFTPFFSLLPVCGMVLLYTPAFFLLADGEKHWTKAMNNSEKLVRSEWAAWTGLWTILGLAHLFGFLLCIIPSIFITPWMVVALAMRYERQRGEVMPDPATAQSDPPMPPPIPGAH